MLGVNEITHEYIKVFSFTVRQKEYVFYAKTTRKMKTFSHDQSIES